MENERRGRKVGKKRTVKTVAKTPLFPRILGQRETRRAERDLRVRSIRPKQRLAEPYWRLSRRRL